MCVSEFAISQPKPIPARLPKPLDRLTSSGPEAATTTTTAVDDAESRYD